MDGRYWMKMSTVNDLPAGAAVIRDIRWVAKVFVQRKLWCGASGWTSLHRVWHGGCPAVGDTPRAMPDCHFFAPWVSAERARLSRPLCPDPRPTADSTRAASSTQCRGAHLLPTSRLDAALRANDSAGCAGMSGRG